MSDTEMKSGRMLIVALKGRCISEVFLGKHIGIELDGVISMIICGKVEVVMHAIPLALLCEGCGMLQGSDECSCRMGSGVDH